MYPTDRSYILLCFSSDTPPGTSDEHLTVVKALKNVNPDGAVIVTTPQDVALATIRKELNFCRKMDVKVLGIVENMSGYVCPYCQVRCNCTATLEVNVYKILPVSPVAPSTPAVKCWQSPVHPTRFITSFYSRTSSLTCTCHTSERTRSLSFNIRINCMMGDLLVTQTSFTSISAFVDSIKTVSTRHGLQVILCNFLQIFICLLF